MPFQPIGTLEGCNMERNRDVREAVGQAVYVAVSWDTYGVVDWAVYDAVTNAVTVAVYRDVDDAVNWAVDDVVYLDDCGPIPTLWGFWGGGV
jgi:hypothetical protein